MRVGQKNKLTYRWARKGSRPRAIHDQRTQSTYLFGAVCPERGAGAALVLPACNTEAMRLHLDEIATKKKKKKKKTEVPTTLIKTSLLTRLGVQRLNLNRSRFWCILRSWFAEPSRSGTAGSRPKSPPKAGTRPTHHGSRQALLLRPGSRLERTGFEHRSVLLALGKANVPAFEHEDRLRNCMRLPAIGATRGQSSQLATSCSIRHRCGWTRQ